MSDNQDNLLAVTSAVKDFFKTIDSETVLPIDSDGLIRILVDTTMLEGGGYAPEHTYSISRAGNQYNAVAKGFKEKVSFVNLCNIFLSKDRSADKSCIGDMIWHPADFAISIQANSLGKPISHANGPSRYSNPSVIQKVSNAVREYMKSLNPDQLISIDKDNLTQILIDVTMLEDDELALQITYSITRSEGQYNVVAYGFKTQASFVDICGLFLSKERSSDKSCIVDMIWYPKEFAIAIIANSLGTNSLKYAVTSYGTSRTSGRSLY